MHLLHLRFVVLTLHNGVSMCLSAHHTTLTSTGHNRRRRLLFIAKKCPPLRIQALKTCTLASPFVTVYALHVKLDYIRVPCTTVSWYPLILVDTHYIARSHKRMTHTTVTATVAGLHDHKESGMLTTAALRVGLDLSDACAAAGRPQDDEPGPTEAQVQATTTALAAEHESLEATLKQARTQMVKESVRVCV